MAENASFVELCALTTELFPQFGARSEAFQEACRKRPDLAARATYPSGKPVAPRPAGALVQEAPTDGENALIKAAERLAAQAKRKPGARDGR